MNKRRIEIMQLLQELDELDARIKHMNTFVKAVIEDDGKIVLDLYTESVAPTALVTEDEVEEVLSDIMAPKNLYACYISQDIMLRMFAILVDELKSDRKIIKERLKKLKI